jgi:hypothetical protein
MSDRERPRDADAEEAEIIEAWEGGKPVDLKVELSDTTVLSIRVPRRLTHELSRRARLEGKPASAVARDLLERALESGTPSTPPELARAFSRWVEEITHRKPAS